MPKITLWGLNGSANSGGRRNLLDENGSTFARTVRMLLAEKGVTDYEQVSINVLKGELRSPEHLKRHPFAKIPVVDVDGFRVIETPAITRYLNAILPGVSLVPSEAKDAARMDMVTSIIGSYGYPTLIGAIVAYHLFPDFVPDENDERHRTGIEDGKKIMRELMRIKGDSPYLAGQDVSIADLYVAPIFAFITMTPHKDEFLRLPGVQAWWELISSRESFRATRP